MSNPRDLWPLRHLIRVMRRHDSTKKRQWQRQRQLYGFILCVWKNFSTHPKINILDCFDKAGSSLLVFIIPSLKKMKKFILEVLCLSVTKVCGKIIYMGSSYVCGKIFPHTQKSLFWTVLIKRAPTFWFLLYLVLKRQRYSFWKYFVLKSQNCLCVEIFSTHSKSLFWTVLINQAPHFWFL